jgi:hypothetical protein
MRQSMNMTLRQDAISQPQKRLARLIAPVRRPHYVTVDSHSEMFSGSLIQRRCRSDVQRAWADWIHSRACWTMMVTLTFRRRSAKGYRVTETAIEAALRRVSRLINCDLFGKRRTNKGWTIASACTVDFGSFGDHPHAHLLLEAPAGVSKEQLCAVVERAAQRTSLVDKQRVYRQYVNAGGAEYLIKHGTDRMVVPLLTAARQSH